MSPPLKDAPVVIVGCMKYVSTCEQVHYCNICLNRTINYVAPPHAAVLLRRGSWAKVTLTVRGADKSKKSLWLCWYLCVSPQGEGFRGITQCSLSWPFIITASAVTHICN